jgi:hypothetical protein
MYAQMKRAYKVFIRNLKEDLDMDGRKILKGYKRSRVQIQLAQDQMAGF